MPFGALAIDGNRTAKFGTASDQASPEAARKLLAEITDIDLDKESFKFMEWRSGKVAGVPARVYRISFTGELTFEIGREKKTITVSSGGFVAAPQGVAHSLRNDSDRPACWLTIHAARKPA